MTQEELKKTDLFYALLRRAAEYGLDYRAIQIEALQQAIREHHSENDE